MKNKPKKILAGLCSLLLVFSASSCGDGRERQSSSASETAISYTAYETSTVDFKANGDKNETSYNHSLYYRNDLALDMGDPMIVYDDGSYYAYGTRGATSFHCLRSDDLADWTRLADCFVPEFGSWGKADLWAPDIQKIGEKWYLYYTARFENGDGTSNCQLGVAVGDSPAGPFKQYTGTNADGKQITLADTPFQGMERRTILDSTVFEDDDGQLYMYFSYDTTTADGADNRNCAEIWGVRMKDPVTWDLSTLTRLISPGYKKLSDSSRTIDWETWSPSFENEFECAEGPYMVKREGKYFLTYCANSFVDTEYSVGYAIGNSPLGEFEKPDGAYLQNMILGVPGQLGTYINTRYLGFMTGTGHASVFKAGDEYMLAYHAHTNRDVWGKGEHGEWRSLAVDYLYFDESGLPYANGPTYSLTRLPEITSGYKNLAAQATVRIDGEGAAYINDNFTNRAYRTEEVNREAQFKAGTRSIEITFSSPKKIKAVNVFNSYDYTKKTDFIRQIDFGEGRGVTDVLFNQRYVNKETKFIYPHAAYNVELTDEIETSRIVITFETTSDFAVGEVEILGRD